MSDLNDPLKESYIGKVGDALSPYVAELKAKNFDPTSLIGQLTGAGLVIEMADKARQAAEQTFAAAVANVRRRVPITVKIEVEVENLLQVEEALSAGADVIMFDNMNIEDMTKAVKIVAGRVPLEASGNVTLANVKEVAGTGVNYISSGALTHSVTAADISLRVEFRDAD